MKKGGPKTNASKNDDEEKKSVRSKKTNNKLSKQGSKQDNTPAPVDQTPTNAEVENHEQTKLLQDGFQNRQEDQSPIADVERQASQKEPGEEEVVMNEGDLSLKEHVTVETKGRGLAEHLADVNRSFNATEQYKQGEAVLYEPEQHQEVLTDVDQFQEKHEGDVADNQDIFDGLDYDGPASLFSETEIELIQQSWAQVAAFGTEKVAKVFYKNIFTIAPESLQLFSFKNEKDMYNSELFKKHGTTVITTVGTAVSLLGDLPTLVPVLQDLGYRHAKRGILPEHYPIVGQALKNTLKAGLKKEWSKRLTQVWDKLLGVVTNTMMGELYTNPEMLSDELTQNKINVVTESWNKVYSLGATEVGKVLFQNLFALDPELLKLFPFADELDYENSEMYLVHVTVVVQTVNNAIQNLNSFDSLKVILQNLGKDHMHKGVKKENYDTLGSAVLKSLEQVLGDQWNFTLKKFWELTWDIVKKACIAKNYDEKDNLENLVKISGLTKEDIDICVKTWRLASSLNTLGFGLLLMDSMYKICPEVNSIFQFPLEREQFVKIAGDFGTRIFRQMTKCVAALDQVFESPEILESIAIEVRTIHSRRDLSLDNRHHTILREALLETIEGSLERELNNREKTAWVKTYNLIRNLMHDCDLEKVNDNVDKLDTLYVRIVQQSWKKVKRYPIEISGPLVYKHTFTLHPQALELFPFKDQKNYLQTAIVKKQTAAVLGIVGRAIESLDNFDSIVTIFTALGEEHVTRRIVRAHYNCLEDGIYGAIKEVDGPHWDFVVEKAWRLHYFMISEKMFKMNEFDPYSILVHPQKKLTDDNATTTDRNQSTRRPLKEQGIRKQKTHSDAVDAHNENILKHYSQRFQREVDFHHKISYRFEKAYRLGKNMPDKRHTLNLEIIDCISDHSAYIEADHMSLFYLLFFCIYFRNEELMNFVRLLIQKVPPNPKVDKLLEMIDIHGIDRLRQIGEQSNQLVYHMVLYQSMDDDLRIVYSSIMRQMRFVQLRDSDAVHLLNTRDYDIIRSMFVKYSTKINIEQFGYELKEKPIFKCQTYRKYNQAYFEEIVINYNVESRVSQNYRERFLVSAEEIYIVFEMYCKEDYEEQFAKVKKDQISHKQFLDLFIICLKADSFKIAMMIYSLYITPSKDIDEKMMDIIMETIKNSQYYHEIKLFFIHEHFDVLSVKQLNNLVDIYQQILHTNNIKLHPIVNQFNTIKVALLIYRICWKIEVKQIYSLITKCTLLQDYLVNSLCLYFEKQNNILTLYKLMLEPILHMSERKDSLDIMYEMNMQTLLQHPVVVEVLNLVNEGKYSINATPMSMSQSFVCLSDMRIASLKSIFDRLVQNIVTFGSQGNQKQSALMYNIWKQSINQRQQDEMFFTSLFCILFVLIQIVLNVTLTEQAQSSQDILGGNPYLQPELLRTAKPEDIAKYCTASIVNVNKSFNIIGLMSNLSFIYFIGTVTSCCQQITIYRIKDNVQFQTELFLLQFSGAVLSGMFSFLHIGSGDNPFLTNVCEKVIQISPQDKSNLLHYYYLMFPDDSQFIKFKYVMSLLIIQMMLLLILMLQRTEGLGETIQMLGHMIGELSRFFATFGLIIILFLITGRFLSSEFSFAVKNYWEVFLDLFNALVVKPYFDTYTQPKGQIYITLFLFLFNILLMSLLVAMFINKYKTIYKNLDAQKRFTIIRLKNSSTYDKYSGGITLTFFPINLFILPFIPPVIYFKSQRITNFLLKSQYSLMMLMYGGIAVVSLLVLIPFIYIKSIANSIFIVKNNRRESYKGQNIVNLIVTIALGPFVIIISIIIDLFSMPGFIFKDSEGFEHKYQQSEHRLTDDQIKVVMVTFAKIFYGLNFVNWRDKHMTLIQLMVMHTQIFKMRDNLHDLFCKGNKDYKEALSKVQDYNMTKILTRQCSIPDLEGNYKESKVELNVIHAVQFDIELYNNIDILLRRLRMGTLVTYIKNIEDQNLDEINNTVVAEKAEDDEQDDELKKVDGVLAIQIGPDGIPLKRNNSDVMNNFWVNFVVRSFTTCEEILAKINLNELRREKRFQVEVERQEVIWQESMINSFHKMQQKYETMICKQFVKYDGTILKHVDNDLEAEDSQEQYDQQQSNITAQLKRQDKKHKKILKK